MRAGLVFGFALLLTGLTLIAQAQAPQSNFPPGAFQSRAALDGAPAASYTGPGDLKPFVAWWGSSAYSAAARGSNAINICDAATGLTCANWITDATTGLLVPTSIGGSACNIISCEVAVLYDQTVGNNCGGSCDLLLAHAIGRPLITNNGPNSTYCLQSQNAIAGGGLVSAGNITQAQPFSSAIVAERTGSTGALTGAIVQSDGSIRIGYTASADTPSIYTGATVNNGPSATDNVFHAIGYVANNASSLIGVDSTSASTVSVGNTTGFTLKLQVSRIPAGSGSTLAGVFCEGGIANAAWNASDIIALNANAHARYGVW